MSLPCCREHNRQLDTHLLVGAKHLWAAASMVMHMWVRSPHGDTKVYIVYLQIYDSNYSTGGVCPRPRGASLHIQAFLPSHCGQHECGLFVRSNGEASNSCAHF